MKDRCTVHTCDAFVRSPEGSEDDIDFTSDEKGTVLSSGEDSCVILAGHHVSLQFP